MILNKSVGRETSRRLKGEPPDNSGRCENEAEAGLLEISLPINTSWRVGKSDMALVASFNVGIRMIRL